MNSDKFDNEELAPTEESSESGKSSWTLSKTDSEFFIQTLLNPPEPGEGLKRAFRRYKERML